MTDRQERNDVLYFLAHVLESSLEDIDGRRVLLLATEAGQISYDIAVDEITQFKDIPRRSWIHDGHTPTLQAVRLKGAARSFRNSMDIMTRRLAEYDAETERRKLEARLHPFGTATVDNEPQQPGVKFDYKLGL